ncbi:guanylate cyclase [Leptospira semungkisensis]|uniref:Guanylate cyclase n=1 Tax=Leptospira semungkisensis TaxID=2484985 RepID=A0A4V6QKK4_9LEPT|nr:peroxidase family protein [Leptospira semungkisensis]TGK04769.1 guanylate cyclase [Leptospira semungkisensis]
MIKIIFENDKEVEIQESESSKTLLQISLDAGIPHTHACGGNARCSTCRVLVQKGEEHLLPRNEKEIALSGRKGFPQNIRLACQTKLNGDVTVRRLVIDEEDQTLAATFSDEVSGMEKPVAILFSDIRNFTGFSESHLPYDVIHILNRYFYRMGEKVLKFGGSIDKYIGDGLMAIFGLEESDPRRTNLAAIRAGLEMGKELEALNSYLKNHLGAQFEIGIGINYGTAILGKLGHPLSMTFTAIGDTVNSASRIESTTKKAKARLLISDTVYEAVKDRVIKGRSFQTKLKGKVGSHRIHEILDTENNCEESSWEEIRYRLWDKVDVKEAGSWVRLVFHAAAIFSSDGSWLGLEGSFRFPSILGEDDNRGVRKHAEILMSLLQKAKEEGRDNLPSFSDLIALSGAIALEKAGGPRIQLQPGREDSPYPQGRMEMPVDSPDVKDAQAYFARMGFSTQEMVALLGTHTLGWHMRGSFTDTPNEFNNDYYKDLLTDGGNKMLACDRSLLGSEETKRMVLQYALDEKLFFKDFSAAYCKVVG